MLKIKPLGKVIAGTMLYFALGTLRVPVAQARSSVFLLRTQCVDAGVGNWKWDKIGVSIGKAVYTSLFYMGPGDRFASLTCKIMPEGYDRYFQTLSMGFGMRDNDRRSPPITVNVYLDGRRAASQTVSPGEKESFTLNVTNVRDVAIETICSSRSQYCDRVYFYRATLEPIPLPPTEKK